MSAVDTGYTCWTEQQEIEIQDRVSRVLDSLIGDDNDPKYSLWVLWFVGCEVARRRRAFRRQRARAGAR